MIPTNLILVILLLIVFFLLVGLNSLIIHGFYAATRFEWDKEEHSDNYIEPGSKMILWWVKYYSNKWFGDFWSKPICDCPICMSSLHSLWIWLPIYIHFPFEHWLLWMHACFILALAGVNLFISKKVDL